MTADSDWHRSGVYYCNQIPANGQIAADFARREVAKAARIGASHFLYWVDLDGLMIYPSAHVPQDARLEGRDLLRELVDAARKAKMRFIAAWMGMHVQTYLGREHPDWRLVKLNQPFWTDDAEAPDADKLSAEANMLCINSPLRQVLLGQFEEVLSGYEVDGIYQDGLYFPEPYCFCPFCRAQYRQMFGDDMPVTLLDPKRAELRQKSVISYAQQVRQVIDRSRCEAKFFLDCHGTIIGAVDSRECIDQTCRFADAYMLECYPELISEPPHYVALETDLVRAETKKAVISPKWIAWNPDRALVPLPEAGLRLWAWQAVMHGAAPVFLEQRVTDFAPHVLASAGRMFADVNNVQEAIGNAERPKYAALLHSMTTKAQTLPYQPRQHRRYFEGWWTALHAERVPFDVITETDILDSSIGDYRVLILPNVRCMSDEVARAIKTFVERGGGLVMSGATSLEDEQGNRRDDLALGDIAGVRLISIAKTAEKFGRPLTHYYRAAQRHPISKSLSDTTFGFAAHESMVYVEPQPDTQAIFRLTAYDEDLVKSDRYFVSYPTDELADPVVLVREGKGRVVTIPAPLDATYWELGWPETRQILARSAVWAAKRKSPFEVDAPPCVHAALFRRKDATVLMLLNLATNPQYAVGYPGAMVHLSEGLARSHYIHYIVPQSNITATLRLPKKPRTVTSITGQPLKWTHTKGKLTVHISQLREYEGVVVIR